MHSVRPRLLDLFCKQGGCSRGYRDAGFDVIGVDIDPQPRYPGAFTQGDAMIVLRQMLNAGRRHFDVIHALHDPVRLCGSSFGLQVRRHRLFECIGFTCPPPPPCRHAEQGPIVGVYGRPHGNAGAWPGMLPGNHTTWSRAMGIDWMDVDGLSQAIPPAYTKWLGVHAIRAL